MYGVCVSVCICVLVAATRLAAAQSSDAQALFNEADKLQTAGKIDQACEAFAASNRVEPRAGTLIRLGQCREEQGRLASAWSAYKDALTRVKDPAKKALAERRVADLEPQLSFLTVRVTDENRVEGLTIKRNGVVLDPGLWNRASPVDGDTYKIEGHAPGHEAWSTSVTVRASSDNQGVDVPRFKALPTPTQPATREPTPTTTVPAPSTFTGRRKAALAVAGVSLIAGGAGLVLGRSADQFSDDAFALCPTFTTPCSRAAEAQDLLARGRSRALYANISFGIAGAALIGAAVLWFTGAPAEQAELGVTASSDDQETRIGLWGTF